MLQFLGLMLFTTGFKFLCVKLHDHILNIN
jgi:hypothetical protein